MSTCGELENVVLTNSNSVDFYNFMLDEGNDPIFSDTVDRSNGLTVVPKYSRYLGNKQISSAGDKLSTLMNGPIRQKLRIIPENVLWTDLSTIVVSAMTGDFMKPRIIEVDELLAKGVNVTIYNGQLDVICSTKGVEAWINKLKWTDLQDYLRLDRTPLYCGNDDTGTKGFGRSHKNLHFFWILGAGHFVPAEQPCISLQMVGKITQSPHGS